LAKEKVLVVSYYKSLSQSLRAALVLRNYNIAACELVDKVLLDLHAEATHTPQHQGPKHAKVIHSNPYLDLFYELRSEAILITEFEGETLADCLALAQKAATALRGDYSQTVETITKPEEQMLAWDLRRHSSPILNKVEGGKVTIKPLWAVEDVCLPYDVFVEYVEQQQKIFQKHGLVCSFFGHAASANLHIDPVSVDPRQALQDEAVAKLYDLVARESYSLVIRLGGSISGEHGDGILRTEFLPEQYPSSYPLFAQIKAIFDPAGIMNPGKIVRKE
jgi:FAD/FMN-containing dehydrogenase